MAVEGPRAPAIVWIALASRIFESRECDSGARMFWHG